MTSWKRQASLAAEFQPSSCRHKTLRILALKTQRKIHFVYVATNKSTATFGRNSHTGCSDELLSSIKALLSRNGLWKFNTFHIRALRNTATYVGVLKPTITHVQSICITANRLRSLCYHHHHHRHHQGIFTCAFFGFNTQNCEVFVCEKRVQGRIEVCSVDFILNSQKNLHIQPKLCSSSANC